MRVFSFEIRATHRKYTVSSKTMFERLQITMRCKFVHTVAHSHSRDWRPKVGFDWKLKHANPCPASAIKTLIFVLLEVNFFVESKYGDVIHKKKTPNSFTFVFPVSLHLEKHDKSNPKILATGRALLQFTRRKTTK